MKTKPDGQDDAVEEALPDGERSHVDGSAGIDNRIDGKAIPEPPDTLTSEQVRQQRHDTRAPDQRKTRIV